jgi:hypothetical protein
MAWGFSIGISWGYTVDNQPYSDGISPTPTEMVRSWNVLLGLSLREKCDLLGWRKLQAFFYKIWDNLIQYTGGITTCEGRISTIFRKTHIFVPQCPLHVSYPEVLRSYGMFPHVLMNSPTFMVGPNCCWKLPWGRPKNHTGTPNPMPKHFQAGTCSSVHLSGIISTRTRTAVELWDALHLHHINGNQHGWKIVDDFPS